MIVVLWVLLITFGFYLGRRFSCRSVPAAAVPGGVFTPTSLLTVTG